MGEENIAEGLGRVDSLQDSDNVTRLRKLADRLFLALLVKNGLTTFLDAAPEHWQEEIKQDVLCIRACLHEV